MTIPKIKHLNYGNWFRLPTVNSFKVIPIDRLISEWDSENSVKVRFLIWLSVLARQQIGAGFAVNPYTAH